MRNHKICKEITLKYGYHLGKGKDQVNRQQLKGADKIKYELHNAIKTASAEARSWNELEARLKSQEIEIIFKHKIGTNEIQGISFTKSGLQFKGSKIDRALSFGKLDAVIRQNQKQSMMQQFQKQPVCQHALAEEKIQPATFPQTSQNDGILDDLFNPVQQPEQTIGNSSKKKKRKQYLGHSL